ncbi:MAG TPA: amino acid permease [Longimicrobiales bacterium]
MAIPSDAPRASARAVPAPDTVGAPADTLAAPDRLPRRLGLWSAIAVAIGSTIGSGIFGVPAGIAQHVGTLGAMVFAWTIGAVVALFGALTVAELSAMYPRSGGVYVYLREAYGPVPAFLFGWTELLVIRPSALGGIAMIFAGYLGQFVPMSDGQVRLVAAGAIAILAAANIRSVTWGAAVENATTGAKVLALGGLSLLVFAFAGPVRGALVGPVSFTPTSWGGFGVALIAILWAYDGWADLTFMAGEVRDPGRTLPRALLGGTVVVMVVYLLANLAYVRVLPMGAIAQSKAVAADTASLIFGDAGRSVVAALVMVSCFGTLNASTMTGPRILFAMADDGLFFRPVAAVHPRWRTPWTAIALAALLGIAYVSIQTFEQLADAFILGIWPFYALAVGAVFILRRTRADALRPYRTWGYPLVPLVFLAASVALLANALAAQPWSSLAAIFRPGTPMFGFAIILVGIPVFYIWRALGGGRLRTG